MIFAKKKNFRLIDYDELCKSALISLAHFKQLWLVENALQRKECMVEAIGPRDYYELFNRTDLLF